jgi:carbamate kinase
MCICPGYISLYFGQLLKTLVSLISYVVVDEKDPAFQNLTKPIGPRYSAEKIRIVPFPMKLTSKGYRRVVASPRPLNIVERREIENLIKRDFIVICCGGGGIPMIKEGRSFCGVDAVIDKYLASAKLAEQVGGHILLIATDVRGAALHYGTPKQEYLRNITLKISETYLKNGHFPAGSMGLK